MGIFLQSNSPPPSPRSLSDSFLLPLSFSPFCFFGVCCIEGPEFSSVPPYPPRPLFRTSLSPVTSFHQLRGDFFYGSYAPLCWESICPPLFVRIYGDVFRERQTLCCFDPFTHSLLSILRGAPRLSFLTSFDSSISRRKKWLISQALTLLPWAYRPPEAVSSRACAFQRRR